MRKIKACNLKSGDVCKMLNRKHNTIFLLLIKNRRRYFRYWNTKENKFQGEYYWHDWDHDFMYYRLFNINDELKKQTKLARNLVERNHEL